MVRFTSDTLPRIKVGIYKVIPEYATLIFERGAGH